MPKYKVIVNRVDTRAQAIMIEAPDVDQAVQSAEEQLGEDDEWSAAHFQSTDISAITVELVQTGDSCAS